MDINGWYVRDNAFIKGFINYVVEVKAQEIILFADIHTGTQTNEIKAVDVTIWKGEGYEDTKHTETFGNFEDAFKFVEEFSKQKFFDQAVEEYFKCESKSS